MKNITVEYFEFDQAFRQRMYGRKGIGFNVDLLYEGLTSEAPNKYTKIVDINYKYCILYTNKNY